MNKIVAIQADPIEKINPKTDTTLLLALEAQKRKHKIYWFESKDVSFVNSKFLLLHCDGDCICVVVPSNSALMSDTVLQYHEPLLQLGQSFYELV